jgi:hypothetical protein
VSCPTVCLCLNNSLTHSLTPALTRSFRLKRLRCVMNSAETTDEDSDVHHPHRHARVTGGLLSNLGGFVIRIRIPCIVHVSCMYRERILMCPVHIHQDTSGYNKIHLQIRTSLDTIEIHVSHYVSLMYPACILNVSSNLCRMIHVSHMYPACIPRARYIYPDVSDMYPKMYLGLVWDTCKIHAKNQDTCILLECNRAYLKIHLRYIRIH